jgi:hypothetical protein
VSRYACGDVTEMWRAFITTTYPPTKIRPEGRTTTRYDGPFLNKGQATAAINRAKDEALSRHRRSVSPGPAPEVTGHPERSALVWERVPE